MIIRNALLIALSLLSIPALAGSVAWSDPQLPAPEPGARQPVVRQHIGQTMLAAIGKSLVARNGDEQARRTARGVVQDGKLVRMTAPAYPMAAKQAQVSGVVTVEALIGKDGHVVETSVLRGPYPLRRVAEDAVKQWQYEPTLLDGEPVQRVALVNLSFVLGRYDDLMAR
jgi:TonB family protein